MDLLVFIVATLLLTYRVNGEGCLSDQFQCISDGSCIKSTLIRDGNKDCPDGSDERFGRKRVNRVRIDDSNRIVGDGVLQRGPHGELKRVNADKVILNYLTRMKFMTTVIRGEHTLFTTRDTSSTSTATSVLDAALLDVLEKSRGVVTESALVHLGIRTKGPTTTIVNLQTDVSIANVQHLKIAPTKPQNVEPKTTRVKYVRKPIYEIQPPTPNLRKLQPQPDVSVANFQPSKIVPSKTQTIESKPTRANYVRKPIYEAPVVPSVQKVDVKQLVAVPKTYYTQFIYYYTVYDKLSTKRSTRSEILSTTVTTPETSTPNIQIDRTVDSDGFISLGSGPETVNLGKRKVGATTIEVNLAMQSFLRLDGVSNVIVETEETRPPSHSFSKSEIPLEPTSSVITEPLLHPTLDASFISEIANLPSIATPSIENTVHSDTTVLKTRKPIRLPSTDTVRDVVRSRVIINGRHGSRTRSRPGHAGINRIENHAPTVDFTPNLIIEATPTLEATPTEKIVKELESKIETSEVSEPTSKKPLAVTVRKPFGNNRLRTRRPAGPQASNEPKFVVVTRSGPVGSIRPTNNRFRIASRIIKPSSSVSASIEATTTPTSSTPTPALEPKSVQPSFSTSIKVNERGETLAVVVTTVPVIFGLDTSYRTVTLTSTLGSNVATAQPSNPKPQTTLITKYMTSTHTVPFTIGTETFYTKLEITDSTIITETEPLPSEPTARANKFTKASNGVRLIVSNTNVEPTSAVTLQPTLVTGASVVMKDNIKEQIDDKLYDTLTLYTTYTYFTTYYQDHTSVVSSSEKIVSNFITVPKTESPILPSSTTTAQPITVVETSEKIDRSTIYSTLTFYATLFNGSQSTITPIEETKTEILTLREPVKITRTVYPSQTTNRPTVHTRTYYTTYTNLVTFYDKETPVTSEIKETVSNIVTYTIPAYDLPKTHGSSLPVHTHQPYQPFKAPSQSSNSLYVTKNTYTTLTHFITLFSGSNTILSSIEEVSPTTVIERIGETKPPKIDPVHTEGFKIRKTYSEQSSRDLMTALVPSLSTLYTTHTFFTTFFSGTTSVISSREATTSSLVTIYIPYSVAIRATQTVGASTPIYTPYSSHFPDSSIFAIERAPDTSIVQPTPSLRSSIANEQVLSSFNIPGIYSEPGNQFATSQLPSLRLESSRFEELESSIISSVFENLKSSQGLNDDQISSVLFNINAGKSTTTIDGSTVVFLTDLLFKPHLIATSTEGSIPTEVNAPIASITIPLRGLTSVVIPAPSLSEPGASVVNQNIKPGAVIELNDLLSGSSSNFTGNLGTAIKDIVQLIAAGAQKYNQKNKTKPDFERVESSKVLLPLGGVTVTHTKDPIYIPIGATGHNDTIARHGTPKIPVFIPSVPPYSEVSFEDSSEAKKPVYVPPKKEVAPTTTEAVETTETLSPVFHKPEESDPKVKIAASTPRKSQLNFRRFDEKREKESKKNIELTPTHVESSLATEEPKLTKETPSLNFNEGSKALFTHVSSGATTLFFVDGPESNAGSSNDHKTKYVTSVESITRTLTLTTTKVYYTRDSPLTITSEFTTTIPPRTFVSTIIGSRTILGTAGEATKTVDIEPTLSEQTEARTTVTTTTLIFNSITTTVVRTLVIPTAIEATKPAAASTGSATKTVSQRPTRRPIVPYRGRQRPSSTPPPSPVKPPRPRVPYVYKKPTTSSTPSYSEDNYITPPSKSDTSREPVNVLDDDQCRPACNTVGNEICKEFSGKYKCDCRPGFARKTPSSQCEEMQSYIVIVRVTKVNETPVAFKDEFTDRKSAEYQEFAKLTEKEIDKAYKLTSLKDNYISANVNQINKTGNGVLVNFTIHLSHNDELNEDLLLDELTKSLEESESLPVPAAISAEVENVMDLDECSDSRFNDCDPTARCVNEIGSYKCECKDGFPDLNPALPGRTCASEIKSCEYCHSRGDCVRSETGDGTICKCQRMYLGRHCEINGILLATVLPVAAVLSIISVCCIVYCCRKYKKRTNYSKGFKNIVAFAPPTIGANTLDRKAMLETSSESSEHFRPHVYDGPGAMMGEHQGHGSTRKHRMDPNMERNLSGSYSMPPQVVIPRARHPNQSHSLTAENLCEKRRRSRRDSEDESTGQDTSDGHFSDRRKRESSSKMKKKREDIITGIRSHSSNDRLLLESSDFVEWSPRNEKWAKPTYAKTRSPSDDFQPRPSRLETLTLCRLKSKMKNPMTEVKQPIQEDSLLQMPSAVLLSRDYCLEEDDFMQGYKVKSGFLVADHSESEISFNESCRLSPKRYRFAENAGTASSSKSNMSDEWGKLPFYDN